MPTLEIRPETPADHAAIRRVNRRAFDQDDEADLVDRLRTSAEPFVSLVAELDGEIVGHIAFTPARLERHPELHLLALAPMAVDPSQQGEGVGSRLVRAGLDRCAEELAVAVVVLGHPDFYPRFGFEPAHRFGLRFDPDVPRDAFMVLELETGVLDEVRGTVRYHPAFDVV
ncbi:MAG: N-acetyltransferase [Thermoanaerobaculia bacterium]|nr:N-acetyltransferase [Thermoanaerobaculia bacterium]